MDRRPEERREFQRLRLDPPIPGTLGTTPVSVLEIGVLGSRVQHRSPFAPGQADLHFSNEGEEIGFRCEVVRTLPGSDPGDPEALFESGLRFLSVIGESGNLLRRMLNGLVNTALKSRRLFDPADNVEMPVDGDLTVRGSDAAYLCYRYEAGVWQRRHVFLPEQPEVGFTVSRASNSEEMQRLCRVYQGSDDEGRRLIRMFAELSVSEALEIPPRG